MRKTSQCLFIFGVLFMSFLFNSMGHAQDLEPLVLARAPVGMNFVLFGYGYSVGNVFLDNALPIEDLEAKVHTLSVGYVRVFNFFGREAKLDVVVPFAYGFWEGLVNGEPASTERTGFGDPMARLSVNFLGSPALSGRDFLAHRPKFLLGGGLRIRAPLGQYDDTKLINLGTHRWMFKPSLAGSVRLGNLRVEANLNTWFFTTNSRFFNGNTLAQKPLFALQLHVAFFFRPGLWAAVSAGRSDGGATVVNGEQKDNPQKNNRIGAVLSLPLAAQHSIKLAFTSGIITRYGADFDTFAMVYQYRWGGLK
jgi:hypothetical protein